LQAPPVAQGDGQAVGIFGINVCECSSPGTFLAPLAADTGGAVLTSQDDLDRAFADVVKRAEARPIVRVPAVHYTAPGIPTSFSAEGSFDPDARIVGYRWDLDGDGVYEVSTDLAVTSRVYDVASEVRIGIAAISSDGGVGTSTSKVVVRPGGALSLSPGPVEGLVAKQIGPRKVMLRWKAPRSGERPEGYIVYSGRRILRVVLAPRRQAVIAKLIRGKQHRFFVAASNQHGDSASRSAKPILLPRSLRR
jgi:hypothetical protein